MRGGRALPASVVGEIVADLVDRGATLHNLAPFRIGRFANRVAR